MTKNDMIILSKLSPLARTIILRAVHNDLACAQEELNLLIMSHGSGIPIENLHCKIKSIEFFLSGLYTD